MGRENITASSLGNWKGINKLYYKGGGSQWRKLEREHEREKEWREGERKKELQTVKATLGEKDRETYISIQILCRIIAELHTYLYVIFENFEMTSLCRSINTWFSCFCVTQFSNNILSTLWFSCFHVTRISWPISSVGLVPQKNVIYYLLLVSKVILLLIAFWQQ